MRKFYYRIVKNTQGLNKLVNANKLWVVNRVLAGVIAVLCLMMVLFAAWIWISASASVSPRRITDSAWEKEISALGASGNTSKDKGSFDQIFGTMDGRNVFGLMRVKERSGEVQGALTNLVLVGIIPGATPQAVVEDQTSQKTYYLTQGQSIDDMVLDKIEDKKVLLRFKDKSLTLTL